MVIKSTRYISRESAIDRILEIDCYIRNRNYRELESASFEDRYSVEHFIEDAPVTYRSREDLENMTDTMIEDIMDMPFFRFSMFDNYYLE